MFLRIAQFLMIAVVISVCCIVSMAQSADNQNPIFSKPGDDDRPKSIKESLEKMRIDKEKKDYNEMLDRGKEALKLTVELEKAVEQSGKFTEREKSKLSSVDKLVRKIRSGLGGDDDEADDKADQPDQQKSLLSPREAIKTLRSMTNSLLDELMKTTRFSISAAAIQSSNAVLRVARFLRFAN